MHGESGYERKAHDSYETEPAATQALLQAVSLRGRLWEPACGSGKMARVLSAAGHAVLSTDLYDYEFGEPGHDFLQAQTLPDNVGTIVTNPPYADDAAERFVVQALRLTKPGGMVAMLLRQEFDCASGRNGLFTHPAFHLKLVLTFRPRWTDEKKASPRHNYAWYVWDWSRLLSPPALLYGGRPSHG